MHPLYDIVLRDLETDIGQMPEEGHDPAALREELDRARAAGSLDALIALQEDLWQRPSPPTFPYQEPDDWETLSASFPHPESHARFTGSDEDLADRMLAAWRGRCAGCQLGKPVESAWPEAVKEVLTLTDSWPLAGYMKPVAEEERQRLSAQSRAFADYYHPHLTRGSFSYVEPDDDIHYAITAQLVLEAHGPGFSTEQMIAKLLDLTPVSVVWAAGRHMFRTALFGFPTTHTGLYGNPCRQSLGAQIRCDVWGWGAPANPALAARMAYTDAIASQRRNGIYSAVFFAALIADVLAHGEPARAIETARQYLPPRSRFAEMVQFVKQECAARASWEEVNEAIYARYDRGLPRPDTLRINHSLPNAAIVLMALLKGDGDFGKTLGIAVMAGMDTDCNGATAGSIMGCALGTRGIPADWTDPFRDTIRTQLKDLPEVKISELATRLHQVTRANARRPSPFL
jgi:ADP-ribosylglycohydrolase